MQNFRTLGLIIKKVRDLFNLSDKYGKIIQCDFPFSPCHGVASYIVIAGERQDMLVDIGVLSVNIILVLEWPVLRLEPAW